MSSKIIYIASGTLYILTIAACSSQDLHPEEEARVDSTQQDIIGCPPIVPTMSSNTTPSGLVTRSGVYSSSYEAWQAFDGTTATLWLSNMYTSSVWIGYEWGGGTTKTATSYQIRYANGSCCEQRGPKNWTLQGWNGSTWVTVDTVTNQTGWYSNHTRTYTVDTPGVYSKYRLNVTADNYNNPSYSITLVSIASLQLYECSCGNGICGSGESCSSCPSDCGECSPDPCPGLNCPNDAYCTYALDPVNCCCNPIYTAPGAYCGSLCL